MTKNKNTLLLIHKFLKAIADSIIKVFIPLLIIETTGELSLSILYLAFYSLFVLVMNFALKKLLQKHTVLCVVLHFIPTIIAQCLLSFLPLTLYNIVLVAFLMAVSQVLYSVPINLVFALLDKDTNVAKFQVGTNFAKLFFIFISGLLLKDGNNLVLLFILSSIFYIACALPILFAYKSLKQNHINIEKGEVKKEIKKEFRLFHIGFGSFQATMDNCLPLYLYINSLSFSSVTIVMALVELMRILSNFLAKWLVKKKKQRLSCILSCSLFLLSLVTVMFVKIPVVLYICSCLCSICFPLTFVPMFKKYCIYLNENNNTLDGMVVRDCEIFSFRPALYLISLLDTSMYFSFGAGLVSMVVMFCQQLKLTKNIPTEENNEIEINENKSDLFDLQDELNNKQN